jgi:hypothetical protein
MPSSADNHRAGLDGRPFDHTDTGGVGLTDALEMLNDPRVLERVPSRWGDEAPAGRRSGRPMLEPVVWETCLRCGDLAAIVWSSDGEVAGFDCRGGCALTDGQVGELPQRRRSDES